LAKAEETLKREREAFEADLAACNSELKSTESELERIRAQLNMTMEAAKEVEASALTKLIEE
jgi:prefoldin subunit 5